ncbi:hypothetical protein GO685_05015 [Wolbachia endosymbiont of Madathamugadia hiepei]|uniref:hypothetical protein n=1 Tax=Wolbachia endosymbiont of Madathamugadia hiepei TaxID=1241303 RepID=UPI00158C3DDA|nr:hypothetical protein [Wolbachia endosymbiont of Madathamugadia hiepei]NUX01812.1 hypothetical protein [Wolbachia endosymbiont of Madathamugadia hiepei]
MARLENSKNNIIYELVDDKGELTEEDKEKVLKLVSVKKVYHEKIRKDVAKTGSLT